MREDEESRDAQLVRQTLAGDTNAFSELYNQHKDSLIDYVFKKIGNREDAQDIAQDAFAKALVHLRKLRKPEKFYRWLCRITYQLIVDKYREKSKRIELISLSDVSDEKILEIAAVREHGSTEQLAVREAQKAQLFEAIAKLSNSQRRVLLLQAEGKSYKEIAQELKVSVTDVNNWLARGRAKLRVLFDNVASP
jgi:RNA polymerase sigma-70 factor (ECF subfamily)